MNNEEQAIEVEKIQQEGISNVDELLTYLVSVIENAKYSEDMARINNNPIIYSEVIGIKREFQKLLKLLIKDGTTIEMADENEGERQHRENNDGQEGYQ